MVEDGGIASQRDRLSPRHRRRGPGWRPRFHQASDLRANTNHQSSEYQGRVISYGPRLFRVKLSRPSTRVPANRVKSDPETTNRPPRRRKNLEGFTTTGTDFKKGREHKSR